MLAAVRREKTERAATSDIIDFMEENLLPESSGQACLIPFVLDVFLAVRDGSIWKYPPVQPLVIGPPVS